MGGVEGAGGKKLKRKVVPLKEEMMEVIGKGMSTATTSR